MRQLTILRLDDGEEISEKLKDAVKDFTDHVDIRSICDYCVPDGQTGNVTVVIISSLVCQEIQGIDDAVWKRLLAYTNSTMFLVYCRPDGESIFSGLCQRLNVEESKLLKFNIQRDQTEWFTAERHLKIMLSSLATRKPSLIPKERAFTIKPNNISKGMKEVTVVLFEDFPNARDVCGQIFTRSTEQTQKRQVRKIRNGVWTMVTSDLNAGEHTVQIHIDDKNLGEVKLTVQSDLKSIEQPLARLLRSDSKGLMSHLLLIDEAFDDVMAELLTNPADIVTRLHRGLSAMASHDRTDSSNILHVLAEHGCTRSITAMKKTGSVTQQLLRQQNEAGDTPVEVARKYGHTQTKQALLSDSDEEVFQKVDSPLSKGGGSVKHRFSLGSVGSQGSALIGGFRRTGSTGSNPSKGLSNDSGTDSIGSGLGGTVTRPKSSQALPSCDDTRMSILIAEHKIKQDKKGYQFDTNGRQHPYEEIDDLVPVHTGTKPAEPVLLRTRYDPYDTPWEDDPLPVGSMPRRQGDADDDGESEITQM